MLLKRRILWLNRRRVDNKRFNSESGPVQTYAYKTYLRFRSTAPIPSLGSGGGGGTSWPNSVFRVLCTHVFKFFFSILRWFVVSPAFAAFFFVYVTVVFYGARDGGRPRFRKSPEVFNPPRPTRPSDNSVFTNFYFYVLRRPPPKTVVSAGIAQSPPRETVIITIPRARARRKIKNHLLRTTTAGVWR